MQLKADALASHLAAATKTRKLAPLYTVSGDEPLLAGEALDSIRAAARAAGYTEREVLHTSARFDWSQLVSAAGGLSLFADKRILEIRLPTGKPGKPGGDALKAHAANATDGLLTIVALPRLERDMQKAAWVSALMSAGVWVDIGTVERDRLPAWLSARLKRNGQSAERSALALLADHVEGNLLAAQQEIEKLALLYPAGELSFDEMESSVLNVARYDLNALVAAMLGGDGARVVRVLQGLHAEGEPLPLLQWAITEELRVLLRLRSLIDRGIAFEQATRDVWVRREKMALTQAAVRRLNVETLAALLARCAEIDRLFKGLRVPKRDADPWLEFADIALAVATGSPQSVT